jgi:hypothetical protein
LMNKAFVTAAPSFTNFADRGIACRNHCMFYFSHSVGRFGNFRRVLEDFFWQNYLGTSHSWYFWNRERSLVRLDPVFLAESSGHLCSSVSHICYRVFRWFCGQAHRTFYDPCFVVLLPATKASKCYCKDVFPFFLLFLKKI